ncbi:Nuclear pore complex protein NUP155 [Zea mays]|uniref:Nuclear pore complex protein NUP155 n=1 Tax=Zea mays TaxID=4577 RepID=A0A1D6H3B1_MAIZE|nr:Nuclear pore complex protein NUP155 [Zea mays]
MLTCHLPSRSIRARLPSRFLQPRAPSFDGADPPRLPSPSALPRSIRHHPRFLQSRAPSTARIPRPQIT